MRAGRFFRFFAKINGKKIATPKISENNSKINEISPNFQYFIEKMNEKYDNSIREVERSQILGEISERIPEGSTKIF